MALTELGLIVAFLIGVGTVIYSVEVFIEAAAESAVSLGISGFFIAVILAGVDLENAILGIVAAGSELPDLALGTVFGENLFVLAVAVAAAAITVPFDISVPRNYIALLLLVPIPAFYLAWDGSLSAVNGGFLMILFFVLLGYLYWYEENTDTNYMLSTEVEETLEEEEEEDEEDDEFELEDLVPDLKPYSGSVQLTIAIIAIVGMTVGSLITVVSADGLLQAFGIAELAFGATVLSFVASIEELALTVEPVRRNQPELAIGNIVGSTVFYMTANVGVIALLHEIDMGGDVLSVHWPFYAATLLVVGVMFIRGRVNQFGGYILVILYIGYWIFNYL